MSDDESDPRATRSRLIALLEHHGIVPAGLPPAAWRTSLLDQGLMDSMGVVHMLELIREAFGVEIDPDVLAGELTTLDAVAEHLAARQPSARGG